MDVIADQAVMLDNGRCVHNAVLSDLNICIYHDFWHDDGAGPKSRRLRYHRRRMDQRGGNQAVVESSLKTIGPHVAPPNGNQILRGTRGLQQLELPARRGSPAIAQYKCSIPASIT